MPLVTWIWLHYLSKRYEIFFGWPAKSLEQNKVKENSRFFTPTIQFHINTVVVLKINVALPNDLSD